MTVDVYLLNTSLIAGDRSGVGISGIEILLLVYELENSVFSIYWLVQYGIRLFIFIASGNLHPRLISSLGLMFATVEWIL